MINIKNLNHTLKLKNVEIHQLLDENPLLVK